MRTLGYKGGPNHGAGPIQISADGSLVAVGCSDGVHVYQLASGKHVARLDVVPVQLAFMPDGKRIATGGIGDRVAVWDIESNSKLLEFVATDDRRFVRSVDVSPDGAMIASGGIDKTARIWDAETGEPICKFGEHEGGNVFDVAFSRSGALLATACFDGKARVFDIQEQELVVCFEGHVKRGGERVYSNCFSHDDELIVSTDPTSTTIVWKAETGEVVQEFDDCSRTVSALFLPGDARVVTSHYPGWVKLWDVESGECLRTLQAHDGRTQNAALTPCGKTLVTTSMDAKIRLWDVESFTQIGQIDGHKSGVVDVCYSPDGKQLATAHHYGGVSLWDVESGSATEFPYYSMHAGSSVAISPCGKLLAYDSDQTIFVWDIASKECIAEFRRGYGSQGIWWPQEVTFVGGSQKVAFYSADGLGSARHIAIWDIPSRRLHRLIPLESGVMHATASVDGSLLVVMDFSGKAGRIIRLDQDVAPIPLKLPFRATACCIAADNSVVCFGDERGQICWHQVDDATMNPAACAPDLKGRHVISLAISTNGQQLATSVGGETCVWNRSTGEQLAATQQSGLLAFHPSESELAIAADSQIHVWQWA